MSRLQPPPGSFVGRRRELAELRDLVQAHRLVTVTGPGGVGKTRLAIHAAASLESEELHVHIVDLAPVRQPDAVAPTTVRSLGLTELPGLSALDTLDRGLAGPVLLILDNCEHVLAAAAELAASFLRGSGGARCLATSIEPLGLPGEVVYGLAPLSLPAAGQGAFDSEAVQLFLERARAAMPAFHAESQSLEAIATICTRLDGLPLAIELAAARVRTLSPGEIAARLDDRFRLLKPIGNQRSGRHHTLLEALEWSYDLLGDAERTLLQRLAVFPGHWTLAAAETVCGFVPLAATDVLDVLSLLVDRSLVAVDRGPETRYRLLESVREFARGRAGFTHEELELRDRHARWIVGFAERWAEQMAWSDDLDAARRLTLESANIDSALTWLGSHPGGAGGIATLVGALTNYWRKLSWLNSYAPWIERARAMALDGLPGTRVSLAAAIYAHYHLDRIDEAEALLSSTVDSARAQAANAELADALLQLGVLEWHRGRRAEAIACFEAGLAIEGAAPATCAALHAWMQALQGTGADPEVVRYHISEALRIGREHRLVAAEATALNHMAEFERAAANWTAAEALLVRQIEIQDESSAITGRELGVDRALAEANYANVLCRLGRCREAANHARSAVVQLHSQPNPHHADCVLLATAGALWGLGSFAAATRMLAAANKAASVWWEPADEPDFRCYREALLAALPPEEFEPAWAAGSALEPHTALDAARALLGAALEASAAAPPATLSAREREVLDLLIGGLSNHEISEALVLSVRTVESHVANICGKLGVRTRAQAVAAAAGHSATPPG